uniref:Putative secreted protein n=1 Tax=Ixodes ricinus TaxID=34613 RepID=A0A6B0U0R6_IXORI
MTFLPQFPTILALLATNATTKMPSPRPSCTSVEMTVTCPWTKPPSAKSITALTPTPSGESTSGCAVARSFRLFTRTRI